MMIPGGPKRHTIRWALLVALTAGMVVAPVGGQDHGPEVEDALNELLAGALTVHINARIVDEDQNEEVWNMDLTRVTISGRAVTVHLDGRNIIVHAEFTPYWESENELLLVAQGQTWIETGKPGEDPEYRTSFTTLPIRLGEPILFLPLGSGQLPVDTQRFGRLNIELEINVERYQS
ncbi:MAG: hypothetical protein PF508_14195 [Spirochaeta sp.]|jgi:hypothetical protein|nr:hypothetical protein [Spirochaeta sp.]